MIKHWEVLPDATSKVWKILEQLPEIKKFYLAGGTGLALQLGHRISRDLDFFTSQKFDVNGLKANLGSLGSFALELIDEQTVVGILNGIKLSFLGYIYPLLMPPSTMGGIQVAGIADIACMKIDAISSRGTKRDFIDLFYISRALPLPEALELFQKKYKAINYNLMHVKKSLVYFADADPDPMPEMLQNTDWLEVKSFFQKQIVF